MSTMIWRWSAGVALGCAAFGAWLVPFPATSPSAWSSSAPAQLAAGIADLTQVAGRAQAAVRDYRAIQGLDRWAAAAAVDGSDTALVRLDKSVPADIAAAVRSAAADQWAGLGTPASARHAQIFVYVDSASIPRAPEATGTRRVLEPRRLVDVFMALPRATDGIRCVSVVRLRGSSPAHVAAMRGQSVTGACGFYAAFGMPGRHVDEWLAMTDYRFARRSDWSVARAPATDASSIYGLGEAGGRCLTGDTNGCREALRVDTASRRKGRLPEHRLAWVLDGVATRYGSLPDASTARLGDAEGDLLANAVRFVGAERFTRFWTSSSSPDSAFLAASGVTLDAWTQQWLARTYGAAPARPYAGVREVVWLAMALPFVLLIAARPRHRVLGERLFGARS